MKHCVKSQSQYVHKALTVVGHAHGEALVETAVLALVPVLFLDLTVALTFVIFQLQAYGSPEEALQRIHTAFLYRLKKCYINADHLPFKVC